ncbi:MAG: helix-turn-helix domain-containing protein [Pseudomonadota bacterium]
MTTSLTLRVDGPDGLISGRDLERLADLVADRLADRLTDDAELSRAHPSMTMSVQEVCDLLRINKSTINRWQAQGKFPAACSERPKLWRTETVRQWLIEQERRAALRAP